MQTEFRADHLRSIDQIYEQFVRGDQTSYKQNNDQQADAQILTVVENYKNCKMIKYLRKIAHNFFLD